MTDNLKIWSAVEKTDPKHTKRVNQRGGFTAISAHYQVMRATEMFGPVGIGWGYDNGPIERLDKVVVVPVTIWHGTRDNRFGPIYGSAELIDARGRTDADAPKKAATDGLTKGLSHLGFNADVFLGRFDDNKYIAALEQEFAASEPLIDDAQRVELMTLADQSGADMKGFCTFYKIDALPSLPASRFQHAQAMLNKKLLAKSEEKEAA